MRRRLAPSLLAAALAASCLAVAAPAAGVEPAGRVEARALEYGGSAPAKRRSLPPRPSDPAALRAAKAAAGARRSFGSSPSALAASPRASVIGGLNQPGMSAGDGGTLATPPDTTGAIGPSHYVEMINVAVAVYARSNLALVSGPRGLEAFMGAPAGSLVTDPQIIWDQQNGRWFYLALAFTENQGGQLTGPNFLLYGFSRTADPSDLTNGWCRYSLPNGKFGNQDLLDDYPKLGDDAQRLVFGTNAFLENGDYASARIWSVPKPAAGALPSCPAGSTATVFGAAGNPLRTADGNLAFTPVPANTADGAEAGHVVAADDPLETGTPVARNQVMAWHLAGGVSTPTLVPDGNLGVAPYNVPRAARQPGATMLDTLDGRLTQAVSTADPDVPGQRAVWTQHTVDPGDGSVQARWYELILPSRAVRQQGAIAVAGADAFNAAISPTLSGNFAAIFYNVSSLTLAPEIRGRMRGPATPLGGTGPELTIGTSGASAADVSCIPGPCRWGDYSGATPDHSNPFVVWGSNQAVEAPGGPNPTWITRNFAVGRRTPVAAFSFTPASPEPGQRVTFTATSTDPEGTALAHAWDLDDDGSFDDASTAVAVGTFPRPGDFRVRLRSTATDSASGFAVRTVAVRDRTAPRIRLSVRRVQSLARVLRRGLPYRLRSNEAVRIGAQLLVSRRTARRLRLRRRTIGRATTRLRSRGTRRARVRLTRAARRRLRGSRRVVVRLRVTATDVGANRARASRRATLRR